MARSGIQTNRSALALQTFDAEPAWSKTMSDSTIPADQAAAPAGVGEILDVRHLSTDQLAQLGVSQIAYVKQVIVNGGIAYAIHAADGTPMAVAGDRDVAIAAVRQHEMLPTLVH
jgi:hypothetical protein